MEGTLKAVCMSEDLGTEEVTNGVDQITSDTPRDASDNPGLQDHKVDQPFKQSDASFGAGRSTVEQTFNCKVIIEKHQRNLYHNFIDFKKAFDRVCHGGLWKALLGSKIDGGFLQVIQALCYHPSNELF